MKRTSHSHTHTTRGSKTIFHLEQKRKGFSEKMGGKPLKFTAEARKFLKNIRRKERRMFNKEEVPSI